MQRQNLFAQERAARSRRRARSSHRQSSTASRRARRPRRSTACELYVARDKLPPPDEEDEFLLADLIGLSVQNEAGEIIGTVVDVPNYGGGDLLEIAPVPSGATAFLPFTKAFVPTVDVAGKRIIAAPPDDLFEQAKPAPESEDEA